MTINEAWAWVSEHWQGLFGVGGLGTAAGALAQARRIKVTADARMQDALTNAVNEAMRGYRADLEQSRKMAREALAMARSSEAQREKERRERDEEKAVYEREAKAFELLFATERAECTKRIDALQREIETMRRDFMSQHSTKAV